jgi:uncharacterized protein
MQYRTMPKSDEKLSVLGYGCMRLPSKGRGGSSLISPIDTEEAVKQIKYAIDNGVNYLDTAYPYHRGLSESFLGDHILKDGYREKVYIATKLPCFMISKKEKIEEIFNKQIKKLKVDYIDYYLLHSLDGASWDKMRSLDIIAFMDKIKAEGKIRHMGFSFHGKHEDFIRIVDGYDWDFAQVQYNIIDENFQAGIRGIEYAHKKGLGIITMETLRGGALVGNMPKEIQAIYDEASVKKSAVEWAFRWVYNNPAVTLVLSGMNDIDHIKENIEVADDAMPNGLSDEEISIVDRARDKYLELMQVGCTGCGYCMPCPAGIDIPGAFKHLNNYHMFGKAQPLIYHMAYAGIMTDDGKSHFTSTCIDCGQCEEACPQHIEVRKEFKKVQRYLERPVVKAVAAVGRPIMNAGKKE